jgi:hypothetical protein
MTRCSPFWKDSDYADVIRLKSPTGGRSRASTRHNSEIGIMNHFVRERVQNFERPVQLRADEYLVSAIIARSAIPALADGMFATAHALGPAASDPPFGLFKRWEERSRHAVDSAQ